MHFVLLLSEYLDNTGDDHLVFSSNRLRTTGVVRTLDHKLKRILQLTGSEDLNSEKQKEDNGGYVQVASACD